ncbi:MAG: proline--tRNA ligase [Patescibacteria group bacterium]
MRQSRLFTKTTKSIPKDIKVLSYKLLYQAGFIRESTAGRYYFLPLGMRVQDKIVKVIEQEMDSTGALKMITPVLHPIELWKETNRTDSVGFELMKVKDRSRAEFVLGGTAEEMMVDLVRKFTISYKDLPFNIYQFSQKFRDELRARAGLLRVREFLMKDAYSFHADEKDFAIEYEKMRQTYTKVFKRLGLETIVVESDNGYIGGDYCHEFIVISDIGESRFLMTSSMSYAAHEDVAKFVKDNKNLEENILPMKEIIAERGNSMDDGVKFHNLPLWQQIKDVMFVDDKNRMILAVIRGDYDVNETKLKHIVQAHSLRHATDYEIREIGSVPGFISPVKINKDVIVVADDSLRTIKNAYGGANKKNVDLININIDRDFTVNFEGDIAMAFNGCVSENGEVLNEAKGIEVGNIFQLGYHYSKKMNATFMDKEGREKFYYMGCYGIGVGRTLATIVEKFANDKGMLWPFEIAPFQVHLVNLNKDCIQSDEIYEALQNAGLEVLYDDRNESAGAKFKDADLIGIPVRLVVSPKNGEQIEFKRRDSEKCELLSLNEIITKCLKVS